MTVADNKNPLVFVPTYQEYGPVDEAVPEKHDGTASLLMIGYVFGNLSAWITWVVLWLLGVIK